MKFVSVSKHDAALPAAFAVVALLAVTLFNPLGYRGGGGDDWHYLEAARCAAAHGLCPPANHWWARLPLVLPMGWAIAGGGESRLAVGLVPFLYALAAIICVTLLVQRQFGRGAAIVAGGLLAMLPVAAFAWLQPNVDVPELAFLAAALLALDQAARTERRRWALAAGALLGLAILARPTALVWLPVLVLLPVLHPPLRRLARPAALGLAAPLLAEALAYALWLGDPLTSWRLSLGHAALATDELPPGFHPSRGPLFNPDYIAAWRRSMDLHVHWTVDPVLNLFATPKLGLLLGGALLLLLLAPPRWRDPECRKLLWLLGAAMLGFGALTYALAIDPKPRMFLPVAAIAAAIAGVQVMRLRARGRVLLAATIASLVAALSLVRIADEPGLAALEPPAGAWVTEAGARLAVENRTARFLTLVPGVRQLPLAPAADKPLLLVVGFDRCEALPEKQDRPVRRSWYQPVSRGREVLALCLYGPASTH